MEKFTNGQYFKVFTPVVEDENSFTLNINQQEILTEIFKTLQLIPMQEPINPKPKLELIIGGKK